MLSLHIKFSSGSNHYVTVSPERTVRELKRSMSELLNIPEEDLQFILGGHVLPDDQPLETCGVENQTVLHAYQQRASGQSSNGDQPSLDKLGNTVDVVAAVEASDAREAQAATEAGSVGDAGVDALQSQFFVYCKTCQALQPGKLRVKCSVCKDETFIVGKDPGSWEDVLNPRCISGQCQAGGSKCVNPFAEFYFKCREPHSTESQQGNAVVLHHVRPNRHQVECIACASVQPIVLVYPCPDGHVICVDCFKTYGTVALGQRSFHLHPDLGYTLACPGSCADGYIEESHHFRLLGSDQYERYQRFATEDSLREANGVQCPRPGCGEGALLEEVQTHVTCPACGHRYCRLCLRDLHPGDCAAPDVEVNQPGAYGVDPNQAQRAQWEVASRQTVKTISKPCPGCRCRTERDGGCMHMRCSRCPMDWCWLCEKPWDRNCMEQHWFGT